MMSIPKANLIKERFVQHDFEKCGTHCITLGKPERTPFLIPVLHNSSPTCFNTPFPVNGEIYKVTAMSFETPHGAVFVEDVDSVDVPRLGHALGTHPLFPKGASIVFIQKINNENVKVRVWQNGKGEVSFSREAVGVAGTTAILFCRLVIDNVNVCMNGKNFFVNRNNNKEINIFYEE